jgi:hypothetical protein
MHLNIAELACAIKHVQRHFFERRPLLAQFARSVVNIKIFPAYHLSVVHNAN